MMSERREDIPPSSGPPGRSRPMPVAVTLPDGSRREFPAAVTGAELAAAIGPGLAKAAVAVKIDGRPRDLATVVDRDVPVHGVVMPWKEVLQSIEMKQQATNQLCKGPEAALLPECEVIR